jgi:DNA-binding transcriptional regulator LsrR (DeoR family)
MTTTRAVALSVALAPLVACYHATIETGLTPSTEVLEQSFASSWIYGLVPPKTVSTSSRCPDGVAKVETQHTFVNQLVGLLTLGIYTPMHIRVTCAQRTATSEAMLDVPVTADEAAIRDAFGSAADIAAANDQPVLVRFRE